MPKILLASASPRRRELLQQLGFDCQQIGAEIDETPYPQESPAAYVMRMACHKAAVVSAQHPDLAIPLLAADTSVVYQQRIYGKPTDRADADAMLKSLSAHIHTVMTAVAVIHPQQNMITRRSDSLVAFKQLSDAEIQAYIDTGEPYGKAGAYAIQGQAAQFIVHLEGSYSGVMGLPLYETGQLLSDANTV